MTLEHYEEPPIVEVICGFRFESIPGLDPLTIGWFAQEVRERYPKREIRPALADGDSAPPLGVVPLRAWLTSANGSFLLQVQHDRFYLNWRRVRDEPSYPRFNDHDGNPGILSRALVELDAFQSFCATRLGHTVVVTETELAKVDHLRQGTHWGSRADLLALLPAFAPLAGLAGDEEALFGVHIVRPMEGGRQLLMSITMAGVAGVERVQLETRSEGPFAKGASVEEAMRGHNEILNQIFARAVPAELRGALFRGGPR